MEMISKCSEAVQVVFEDVLCVYNIVFFVQMTPPLIRVGIVQGEPRDQGTVGQYVGHCIASPVLHFCCVL